MSFAIVLGLGCARNQSSSSRGRQGLLGLSSPVVRLIMKFLEEVTLVHDLAGHTREVSCCASSPDSSYLASGSWDKTGRVWNKRTGAPISVLVGHNARILAVCFSRDGEFVLTGSRDGTVRKWEASSGQHIATLAICKSNSSVQLCKFGRAGSLIACVASGSGTANVWNGETGAHLFSLSTSSEWPNPASQHSSISGNIELLAISPGGESILTGSGGALYLWSADSGQVMRSFTVSAAGCVLPSSCSISPDQSTIVTGSSDRTLKLWDTKSGRLRAIMKGHCGVVTCCEFSPSGKTILSGSEDKTIKLWDSDTHELKCTLRGPVWT